MNPKELKKEEAFHAGERNIRWPGPGGDPRATRVTVRALRTMIHVCSIFCFGNVDMDLWSQSRSVSLVRFTAGQIECKMHCMLSVRNGHEGTVGTRRRCSWRACAMGSKTVSSLTQF